MTHWLFDGMLYGQLQQQRKTTSRVARRSARRHSAQALRIGELEGQIERLSLVTQALWELVKTDRGLSDDDLAEQVKALDLLDGKLDGKAPTTVSVCTACERIMSPDHERCLYCGAERLERAPFEGL